jgi:hypothetical protein
MIVLSQILDAILKGQKTRIYISQFASRVQLCISPTFHYLVKIKLNFKHDIQIS